MGLLTRQEIFMAIILVTGGHGFVGSHLVSQLLSRGNQVRILDLSPEVPSELAQCAKDGQLEIRLGDIRDEKAVSMALRGIDSVFHLAANPRLWTRRRGDFFSINQLGAKKVLETACRSGCRRVVHCSTESILTRRDQVGAIRPNQVVPRREVVGPYCRSKHAAEVMALGMGRRGWPIVVVNPTLPVGPGDRGLTPPGKLIRDFCRGKRREFIHAELNLVDVRDVARGMILAMEKGIPGRRYLLGGENMTVRELFGRLSGLTGLPGPRWQVPYPVALLAGWVGELAADLFTGREPEPSITGVTLAGRRMVFDPRESLEELGLVPGPVNKALLDAINWFRSAGMLEA